MQGRGWDFSAWPVGPHSPRAHQQTLSGYSSLLAAERTDAVPRLAGQCPLSAPSEPWGWEASALGVSQPGEGLGAGTAPPHPQEAVYTVHALGTSVKCG